MAKRPEKPPKPVGESDQLKVRVPGWDPATESEADFRKRVKKAFEDALAAHLASKTDDEVPHRRVE